MKTKKRKKDTVHIEADGWVWIETKFGVTYALGDIDVDVLISDKRRPAK
jgi:hypothetical protein